MNSAKKWIVSGFGRSAEPASFISVEPNARTRARQFASKYGGRVYRAVAVGKVISKNQARDLGRGYIVAKTPPIEFAYWHEYYAKIMSVQDMSKRDRYQYVRDFGEKVFEDPIKNAKWFKSANRALGGVTPASLMKSKDGAEQVVTVLGRMEFGIIS